MSEQQPAPPRAPSRGLVEQLFERRRVLVVLAVLLVELVVFAGGLLTPLSASTLQGLNQQASSQFGPIRSAAFGPEVALIFSHNLAIALGEMVPGLGALLLLFSIYTTGLVAQALVVAQGLPGPSALFLFAFPYSFVELSGYAIATGAGVMLLAAWRGKRLRQELKVLALEVVAVVGVLLVAATMETTTTYSPLLGLALWVPTGLAMVAVRVLARRRALREKARNPSLVAPGPGLSPPLSRGLSQEADARAKAFERAYIESHPDAQPRPKPRDVEETGP
ncbi:MAG: stage II sporulation protein M [Nitrososphaerota archaeon]|nr:stage II sporulation protein M [Nitrososphaerota archaeon]MDG6960566.1 stage II sporulation protein M [Nitrososphaerota archaeon]MDG7014943.1 stage II sporulation protein M [Nitrososphaerota archaeon]WGO50901.1 MAG: stage II sporulation protein M [Nitrososphaerota archaeon]